jgi:hypothetical protein
VKGESDNLEALLKAYAEAIDHLRSIIQKTEDRLTLLALHVHPDSQRPPMSTSAELASPSSIGSDHGGQEICGGGTPRLPLEEMSDPLSGMGEPRATR